MTFLERLLRRMAKSGKGEVAVTAVVIRADGTTEDLGQIAKGVVTMTPEAR